MRTACIHIQNEKSLGNQIFSTALLTKMKVKLHNHNHLHLILFLFCCAPNLMAALKQIVSCHCGKVKLAVDAQDVLRFVCYCKDCRGYHQTLNRLAESKHLDQVAPLDSCGGVDWTHCYPNEITVLQGKELLETRVLHPESAMYRVYSSCCYTPMFSLGQGFGSALLSTGLLLPEQEPNTVPEARFRIMGRQALIDTKETPPKMSWSVPLSWFWVMPRRIHKDRMQPSPVDVDQKPAVLEGFKEG